MNEKIKEFIKRFDNPEEVESIIKEILEKGPKNFKSNLPTIKDISKEYPGSELWT